jgi:hypothetical protein
LLAPSDPLVSCSPREREWNCGTDRTESGDEQRWVLDRAAAATTFITAARAEPERQESGHEEG